MRNSRSGKWMNSGITALAVVLFAGFAAGCGQSRDAADSGQSADDTVAAADTAVTGNRRDAGATPPPGRYQLPTAHTPVPDLWISLPEGYQIQNRSKLPNDEFYIFRSDDPSLTSEAITPGVMVIYIGVNPRTALTEGKDHTVQTITLFDEQTEWARWTEQTPDGASFYVAEISDSDIIPESMPELADAPLHLHLFINGSDSTQVQALVGSIGTLSTEP